MTSGAIDATVAAFRAGRGVLVVDDETRENAGDVVFAAVSSAFAPKQSVARVRGRAPLG